MPGVETSAGRPPRDELEEAGLFVASHAEQIPQWSQRVLAYNAPPSGQSGEDAEYKAYEQELKKAFGRIKFKALDLLQARHQGKSYHTPAHSQNIEENGRMDLESIRSFAPELVRGVDILIFETEALMHDAVINEFPLSNNRPGLDMIRRQRGFKDQDTFDPKSGQKLYEHGNEYLSGMEMLKAMAQEPLLKALLEADPRLKEEMLNDIGATYPNVEVVGGKLKFTQPYNGGQVSIRGFVLGENDLRGAYRINAPAEKIIQEGNAEWRELNRPVTDRLAQALAAAAGSTPPERRLAVARAFSPNERRDVLKNVLAWKGLQPDHVSFQREDFYEVLESNSSISKVGGVKFGQIKDYFISIFDSGRSRSQDGQEINSFSTAKKKTIESRDEFQQACGPLLAEAQNIDDETFVKILEFMGVVV